MKKIVKILILCLSCIGACWLLPACSSAIEEPESGGGGDGSTVTLKLNAMVPGYETRARGNEFSPEVEKIDNLRIFVVDKKTKEVVYNSNFTNPFQDRDDEFQVTIDVEKNTTQVVYFLANAEEYCKNLPNSGETYTDLDTPDDLYNLVLTDIPDPRSNLSTRANSSSERIPYTSRYEIEIGEKDVVEETCYIAIAAVKFDIVFNNKTADELTVSSLQINSIADQFYLFPHLKDESTWNDWINSAISSGENKKYITEYSIPEGTDHDDFLVPIGQPTDDEPSEISSFKIAEDNGSYTIPTFYCYESKNDPFSELGNDQHYIIQFQIGDQPFFSEIKTEENHLASLIRSTHVKITVNINSLGQSDPDIIISGEIVDWGWVDEVTGDIEEVEGYPEPHN